MFDGVIVLCRLTVKASCPMDLRKFPMVNNSREVLDDFQVSVIN